MCSPFSASFELETVRSQSLLRAIEDWTTSENRLKTGPRNQSVTTGLERHE